MKYYIFKVKDSANQNYYIINNMYLGYVGFDSNEIRSILEWNAKIKRKYKLIASGNVLSGDSYLHRIFCDSKRFTLQQANDLIKQYKLEKSYSRKWYQVVNPDPNSSESKLAETASSFKVIKVPIYKYFDK